MNELIHLYIYIYRLATAIFDMRGTLQTSKKSDDQAVMSYPNKDNTTTITLGTPISCYHKK